VSKLAEGLMLLALLTAPLAQAADPASRNEGGAVVPPSAQPHAVGPTPDGATLFTQHCAMCHKPADLARRIQREADRDAARAATVTFLAHHARADPTADATIVDWLLSGSTR
jgi:hypothetical protein